MCHPAWARARVAAQHLNELARLRRVRDRIDREYAQPLDVEALAREAGLPGGLLARRFRLAYGLSPYAYLTRRRIGHALALLRRGGLGVAEVAAAVGCATPGVFGARFTELVGRSPADHLRGAAGAGRAPAGPVPRLPFPSAGSRDSRVGVPQPA
ncbi:helix-turn-helix transcriptional regulator [Kitasatospora sp. NPDC054939]